ncbi:family 1 glycosylhydrolase, partial [Psychromonas arctica]
ITFNETFVFCNLGYLARAHPPGIQNDPKKYFQAIHNVFYTHAQTVIAYKKFNQFGEIGLSHVFSPAFSLDDSEENQFAPEH